MSAWGERISRLVHGSTLWRLCSVSGESYVVSSMKAVGDGVRRVARDSFLIQWLTKEPEPAVIVIDLRETRTVGPVVRLLDWAIARGQPYWETTALKRGVETIVELGERAAETRVGTACRRLLAPPEPLADEQSEES